MTISPRIWVLTDSRPGTATQALGLADKLSLPYEIKQLHYTMWANLPNLLLGASLAGLASRSQSAIRNSPFPDLVIAAGRRGAPVARWIKKHHPATKLVHLMRPQGGEKEFDLIAVPEHDCMPAASNMLQHLLTPHRLTAAMLAEAAAQWRPAFAALPAPRIALLVGGGGKHGDFTAGDFCELITRAEILAGSGSLLVSTSRRTSPSSVAILKEALSAPHHFYAPHSGGDNPYFAYLALADAIIVTGDSISMISEAVFTGKPVYIFEGPASPKHRAFHQLLYQRGLAAPLGSDIKLTPQAGLDSAADIAQVIRENILSC